MKFMHLSDLHIGKRVNDFVMLEDQRYILEDIVEIAKDENINAMFIAGDIYDKQVPSADAVKVFDDFITKIAKMGIKIYMISGNHDSAERISFAGRLMDSAGVYIAPVFDGKIFKTEYVHEEEKVNIYMLPFLKPIMVKKYYPEVDIEDYNDAIKCIIENTDVNEEEINVILAHQYVTGASICDSEELAIGGMDNISVEIFDKFDYVALGHIHGPQKVKRDTIRYAGTPLKYSFSEMNHKKSVTIININSKEDIDINQIELKPLHEMREIRGTYEELTLRENYIDTDVNDYLRVILTDEEDIPDAISRLRSIYPNIMKLEYDNKRTRDNQMINVVEEVESKSPVELFGDLYELQNNQKMSEEQVKYISELVEKIWEVNVK